MKTALTVLATIGALVAAAAVAFLTWARFMVQPGRDFGGWIPDNDRPPSDIGPILLNDGGYLGPCDGVEVEAGEWIISRTYNGRSHG